MTTPAFLPPDVVVARFAAYTGAPLAELRGPAQTREISRIRQECMWLLRQVTTASMAQIGAMLGGRTAMTVDEGIDRVTLRAASDQHYRGRLQDLLAVAHGALLPAADGPLSAAIGVLEGKSGLSDTEARMAALSILRGAVHG